MTLSSSITTLSAVSIQSSDNHSLTTRQPAGLFSSPKHHIFRDKITDMRLYLASNDLGDFSEKLLELVGKNHKVLVISNARDHRRPKERKAIVDEDMGILASCGLEPKELDLRPYFHKYVELRKYIHDFEPGCIFAMGGNVYSLATAIYLSGMRQILKQDLIEDKYVYAGYSAGSMNASEDLLNYRDSYGKHEDRLEEAKSIYGEVFTRGLGVIQAYICPHADEEKYDEICKKAKQEIEEKGLEPIILNNSDVVVLQGCTITTLRK